MKSSPLYDYITIILYIPINHEIFPFDKILYISIYSLWVWNQDIPPLRSWKQQWGRALGSDARPWAARAVMISWWFHGKNMENFGDFIGFQGKHVLLTIWLFNIAMENRMFLIDKPSINGPCSSIFHGYVKLPEGSCYLVGCGKATNEPFPISPEMGCMSPPQFDDYCWLYHII